MKARKFMEGNVNTFYIVKKILLIVLLSLAWLCYEPAGFCYEEINKQLNLVNGTNYLLSFDDKVTKYTLENKEAANIEFVYSVFRGNQDMLIKTLKDTKTNLFVWTKDNYYKFNVVILPVKSADISIVTEITQITDDEIIDLPPSKQVFDTKVFGFEIDSPPGKRK